MTVNSTQSGVSVEDAAKLGIEQWLQDVEDFFVAFERRDYVRAGHFRARPGEHFSGALEAAVAGGGACGLQRFQQRLRNYDSGYFIVQAQRLYVAVERPNPDQHRDCRFAAEFFQEGVPMFGIEKRLGHRKVSAGINFGVKALDFIFEIVGDRINGDADREICCAAERLASPVGALVQAMQHLDETDRINLIDAARFRVIADGGRVACDGEDVANAADSPCAEEHGLQADDVVVARGEVRHGFHAARFERTRGDERVHADAGHGAAVDVDGIDFARGHDFVDLLVDSVQRNALRRIDFYAHGKFIFLQFFPEITLGFAL